MKLSFTVATPDVQDPKILALQGNLRNNLSALAGFGYQGVEFMIRDVNQLSVVEVKDACIDHGLEISAISSGQLAFEEGLVISAADNNIRESTVQRMKEIIDFTSELNCGIVNIGTIRGNLPDDAVGKEEASMAAMECMKRILTHAELRNVVIAFEPQCRYVVNWHNTLRDTWDWMQSVESSHFKILFDVYHTLIEEDSIIANLIRYFDRIAHIQFSDTNRLSPGSGSMNFPEIIRVLRALKYRGYISVEVLQRPTGLAAAERSAKYLLTHLMEN